MASAPVPETLWYVSTTTRSRPTLSRSAMRTGTSCMVEQFGLAMMPWWVAASPGFTCDTIRGTPSVMRQAFELSITVAPWATAAGARSSDTVPPAEKRAISTPSKASGTASPTSSVLPPTLTIRPAERPEASRRSSLSGNSRSVSTWIIVWPTTPVAPTIATVSGW